MDACAHERTCAEDEDCNSGEECFINISCTFHASKARANYVEKDRIEGEINVENAQVDNANEKSPGDDFKMNGHKPIGDEHASANGNSAKRASGSVGRISALLVACAALLVRT